MFVIPGMFTVLALTLLYAGFNQVASVQAFFYGLKPAVLAIVVMAVFRIASKSLKTPYLVAVAVLSFIAMFFYQVPFPLVIFGSGILGYLGLSVCPHYLGEACPRWIHGGKTLVSSSGNNDRLIDIL